MSYGTLNRRSLSRNERCLAMAGANRRRRIHAALVMVLAAPEFIVQR